MTNKQMVERIREIDRERQRLGEEKRKYEKCLEEEKKKRKLSEHREHIGECYIASVLLDSQYKHIKAFKILNVLDEPNESYAECLTIIDGCRNTCWSESGVNVMTLGLWNPNRSHLMSRESDPKMIECCKKISNDDFEDLLKSHIERITALAGQ